MSDEINESMEDALDDLFSKSKSSIDQIVELPSRGMGYPGKKGKVTIRTMTFDDEKALSESTPDQDVVNLMLDRCVEGIDVDNLYSPDKLYLLFKIRELSFGTSVKVSGPCMSCKAVNNLDVDLTQLNIEYADEDFEDPKSIYLPDLGKTIELKIPRSQDLASFSTKSKTLESLWRFVKKMDTYSEPTIISQAIKKLSSKDIRIILDNLVITEFGLQNRAKYICNGCGAENVVEVPISETFFTVS